MSRQKVYHFIRGQLFYNDYPKWNGLSKAKKYCHDNNIDESEIYALSNDSEEAYLYDLLARQERGEVYEIKSHEQVCLVGEFKNSNNDVIPNFLFQTSFTYRDSKTNKPHIVYISPSIYIKRELILEKTLYDREHWLADCYLEVYYLDESHTFKEWKISDKEAIKELKKKEHQRLLAQKRAIRDRQKFDRLLKLRAEGKITERQTKELYRLEKAYGGNNG